MAWNVLRHPNVLPLLGVTMTEDPRRFVMVSEWNENGNINAFVKANPSANRLKLVRFCSVSLPSPNIEIYVGIAACRLHQGIGLYA